MKLRNQSLSVTKTIFNFFNLDLDLDLKFFNARLYHFVSHNTCILMQALYISL